MTAPVYDGSRCEYGCCFEWLRVQPPFDARIEYQEHPGEGKREFLKRAVSLYSVIETRLAGVSADATCVPGDGPDIDSLPVREWTEA